MNKSLVSHYPMSEDAFAISEQEAVFRLKTGKEGISAVYFCYGDTAFKGNPVIFTKLLMNKIASDLYKDYYEIHVTEPYLRMVYYFEIIDENQQRYYYYADHFYDSISIDRNDLYKLPYLRKEDIAKVPSWLSKSTVYNIFPDSFATRKNYISKSASEVFYRGLSCKSKLGGTLKGITENLDYIQKLGFNTVYLNPIFTAGEYHKYDLIDYYTIDPNFGTNEDFLTLVNEVHKRNMKIVIDGVFNHSGWNFFAFKDVLKNQKDSIYRDWFYRLDFPIYSPDNYDDIPPYACFGYERHMPKLNTSNETVIAYFIGVVRYWTEKYHIDGWRLDVADEVDMNFWRAIRKAIKSVNPNCAIIGEVWQNAHAFLDGSMFDSVMNYDFRKHSIEFFANQHVTAHVFDSRISTLRMRYQSQFNFAQFNLLDSHDVPRFLSLCKNNLSIYKLAVVCLFTQQGVPMILYGDEQGLTGIKEDDYRQAMVFNNNHELFDFYQQISAIRTSHKTLMTGSYQTVHASEDHGLYVYKRADEIEEITVILNHANETSNIASFMQGNVIFQEGLSHGEIAPYGFAIFHKKLRKE